MRKEGLKKSVVGSAMPWFVSIHVGVAASARGRLRQGLEDGGGGEQTAAAVMVKLIGNQLQINGVTQLMA